MSDLKEYKATEAEIGITGTMGGMRGFGTPEADSSNAGKIVAAPDTSMHNLRGFETPKEDTDNRGKLIGAGAVALMLVAAVGYTFATGMWNSSPKPIAQFVASAALPPPAMQAPMQNTVVPQTAPVENPPEQAAPQTTTVRPVRAAPAHVTAHVSSHSAKMQPAETFVSPPPIESVPQQTIPQDTSIAPPVMAPIVAAPVTPLDIPTQPAPVQPSQTVPVQPAPQP